MSRNHEKMEAESGENYATGPSTPFSVGTFGGQGVGWPGTGVTCSCKPPVMGTEPGSPGRAAGAIHLEASPAPVLGFHKFMHVQDLSISNATVPSGPNEPRHLQVSSKRPMLEFRKICRAALGPRGFTWIPQVSLQL